MYRWGLLASISCIVFIFVYLLVIVICNGICILLIYVLYACDIRNEVTCVCLCVFVSLCVGYKGLYLL